MKIPAFPILLYIVLALKFCTIFYLTLGFDSSSGADQRYELCMPRSCGNGVNISFPFYILNRQNSSCGYPGFEIICNGTYPLLYLPESYYVVEQISYLNQFVHVYNLASLSSNALTNCDILRRIRNTSLGSGELLPLEYYGNVTDLYLFSKCNVSSWSSVNFMNHALPCLGGYGAAMLEGDESLSVALRDCRTNVVAPLGTLRKDHVSNNTRSEDYAEVLRKGFSLTWRENDCNSCKQSGGNCGYDEGFRCFCPDRPHAKTCDDIDLGMTAAASPEAPPPLTDRKEIKGETIFSRPLNKGILIIVGIGIAGFAVLLTLVCFLMFVVRKHKSKHTAQRRNQTELNLNPGPQLYEYSYLKRITNSFSDRLGQGGYGSVYKGNVPGGRQVAVKMLSDSVTNFEDFKNEVSSISRTSHINIVTLLGYCYEGSKKALVYEFMPRGSLNRCIHKNASSKAEHELGLEKKLEIAIGIARGIEYLHEGCNQGILHKDLKPANILLDNEWKPKISDFGLAKLFTGSVKTRSEGMVNPKGTIGYFAPEVFSKNVFSRKSDIYSYGLIVIEMVVGKEKNDPSVDSSVDTYFPEWIYSRLEQNTSTCLDGIVSEDKYPIARKMLIVGLCCIQNDPKERPTISRVIEMLQGSMESLEIPAYVPYSSSHPTPSANTPTSGSQFHSISLPAEAANVSTSGSKLHSHSLPPTPAANA